MDVPVYNMQGQQVGSMKIDEQSLGGSVNPALIKQAYVMYHANQRQGSARTKNRHDVEGSTRKIYKQKGTGNARHGDRKANLFKGGGHGHHKQKTREDFRLDMPKKMRRKANRNAFLAKLVDNEVRVIDSIAFDEAAQDQGLLGVPVGSIKVDRACSGRADPMDDAGKNAMLSGRNVDRVTSAGGPAQRLQHAQPPLPGDRQGRPGVLAQRPDLADRQGSQDQPHGPRGIQGSRQAQHAPRRQGPQEGARQEGQHQEDGGEVTCPPTSTPATS